MLSHVICLNKWLFRLPKQHPSAASWTFELQSFKVTLHQAVRGTELSSNVWTRLCQSHIDNNRWVTLCVWDCLRGEVMQCWPRRFENNSGLRNQRGRTPCLLCWQTRRFSGGGATRVSRFGITSLVSLTPSYTHFKCISRTAVLLMHLYAEAKCSGQMWTRSLAARIREQLCVVDLNSMSQT